MEKSTRNIVVTGPESTGKTELAGFLGNKLKAPWVPEFARSYIEEIQRPYTFDDVAVIARKQIEQRNEMFSGSYPMVIFDTGLLITKVWFEVVFHSCPEWLNDAVSQQKVDLFLLCATDLPWIPDSVRENGGEMREKLFEMYQRALENYGFQYEIVKGQGDQRNQNALNLLQKHYLIR